MHLNILFSLVIIAIFFSTLPDYLINTYLYPMIMARFSTHIKLDDY